MRRKHEDAKALSKSFVEMLLEANQADRISRVRIRLSVPKQHSSGEFCIVDNVSVHSVQRVSCVKPNKGEVAITKMYY